MIRKFCITVVSVLLMFSCTKEDVSEQTSDFAAEPASLSFTVDLPRPGVSTRGYADMENWGNAQGWSLWDKYVDGRAFYRITLFLIDDQNTLVAYRDIYKGSSDLSAENGFVGSNGNVDTGLEYSDKARVTFRYENPVHGDAERLHRGRYRLMAVANYSGCTATDRNGVSQTYAGLGVASVVDGIKSAFGTSNATGIANFVTAYKNSFIDFKLDAGTDRVCPQQPQALTLVKDINLSPGENSISEELIRTYARLRIVVQNNSYHETKDLTLTVGNLALSNNYAQRYAYLFGEPDNEDRFYDNTLSRGAITMNSADAIKAFASTKVDEIDSNTPGSNEEVVFDAYILESRDLTNDYTYTLGLAYESKDVSMEAYNVGGQITNHSNLKAGNQYVIKRKDTNHYLSEGENSVVLKNVGTLNSSTVTEDMIWYLESGGTNMYYIRTIDPHSDTYYYMQTPTSSSIVLSSSKPGRAYTFSTSSNNIRMRYDTGNRYYISSNGTTVNGSTSGNSRNFVFYQVTSSEKSVEKEETVVLKTIDDVTSQVSNVNNIRRNDFVDVLVTVSYVPDSENGYFKFVVDGWRKKEFDIEFE